MAGQFCGVQAEREALVLLDSGRIHYHLLFLLQEEASKQASRMSFLVTGLSLTACSKEQVNFVAEASIHTTEETKGGKEGTH